MDHETLLVIIFILVGIIEIVLVITLMFRKIGLNKFYGFRLEKTLSNKNILHKVNEYMGKDFVVMGIIVLIGSLLWFILKYNYTILIISLIGLLLILIPFPIIIIRGFNYLKNL